MAQSEKLDPNSSGLVLGKKVIILSICYYAELKLSRAHNYLGTGILNETVEHTSIQRGSIVSALKETSRDG